MMDQEPNMERVPLRSTSIRLRRRRDQAKREFLDNRRSGEFGYSSAGWSQGTRADFTDGEWTEEFSHRSRTRKPNILETKSDINDRRRERKSMIEFKNFGLIDCPVLDTTSVPDNHIRNAYVPDKPIRNSYYHDVRQNVQDRMFIMDSRGTPTNPAKLHQIQPKNSPDLRKNPPLQIIYRNPQGYSRTSKSVDRPRSTITDIDVKSKSKPKKSEQKAVHQIKPELRNQIYEQPTSLPVHIRDTDQIQIQPLSGPWDIKTSDDVLKKDNIQLRRQAKNVQKRMRSRSQDKNMIDQEDKMSGMEKILGVDRLPPDIAKERLNRPDLNTMDELKSGVVWVQRDRVFSRWKERFCLVSQDCIYIYKKKIKPSPVKDPRETNDTSKKLETHSGEVLIKVGWMEMDGIYLEERKGYLVISIHLQKEAKLLLRRTEDIREWHRILVTWAEYQAQSRMRSTEEFWSRRSYVEATDLEDWLLSRKLNTSIRGRRAKSEDRSSKPSKISNRKELDLKKSVPSEDSGNSSLNTSTTDSRRSRRILRE